jgi:hypothetical protein
MHPLRLISVFGLGLVLAFGAAGCANDAAPVREPEACLGPASVRVGCREARPVETAPPDEAAAARDSQRNLKREAERSSAMAGEGRAGRPSAPPPAPPPVVRPPGK